MLKWDVGGDLGVSSADPQLQNNSFFRMGLRSFLSCYWSGLENPENLVVLGLKVLV